MKLRYLYTIALVAILSAIGCESDNDGKEDEPNGKSFELSVEVDAYESDTVLTIKDFTSLISDIRSDAEWVSASITDSSSDDVKLKLTYSKNTTAQIRTAKIDVVSKNDFTLTLKVSQKVMESFDDLHDNVSDQPALAPIR